LEHHFIGAGKMPAVVGYMGWCRWVGCPLSLTYVGQCCGREVQVQCVQWT